MRDLRISKSSMGTSGQLKQYPCCLRRAVLVGFDMIPPEEKVVISPYDSSIALILDMQWPEPDDMLWLESIITSVASMNCEKGCHNDADNTPRYVTNELNNDCDRRIFPKGSVNNNKTWCFVKYRIE